MAMLPVVPEWEPVRASDVVSLQSAPDVERIAARVSELGLLPLRWPASWPPDTARVALAATYAKRVGRAVAFSLAAFRQAFAGGRDLAEESTVLIAAAACEMHPTAMLKGMSLRSSRQALAEAGERARATGVTALPAIVLGDAVFAGESAPEQLLEALS